MHVKHRTGQTIMNNNFADVLADHIQTAHALAQCQPQIEGAAHVIQQTFVRGGKILLCGNGGSAADSQHIAAEFVVRYQKDRPALPAIALNTDSSILTAHSNDFHFDTVFARQISALARPEDTLIALSTSGNSPNILTAVAQAQAQQLAVIALTGKDGGQLIQKVPEAICVPSQVTARIQEMHILIAHWWCQMAEEIRTPGTGAGA